MSEFQYQHTIRDTYIEDSHALLQAAIDLNKAVGFNRDITDALRRLKWVWNGVAKHSPHLVPQQDMTPADAIEAAMAASEKLYAMGTGK